MRVEIVPCLRDNYAYVAVCPETGLAAVVDPSEATPVLDAIARLGVRVATVLLTHHHPDHTGGVAGLVAALGAIEVVAHEVDAQHIEGVTRTVAEGDTVTVGALTFRALHVPGHTLGAVAWFGAGAVFTGDTMFLGGCGRLFEGTPAMMHRSLNAVLGALPGDTRVYCGHEYTAANLRFARTLDGDNPALREALADAERAGAEGRATVPGSIDVERATNPYLRCGVEAVQRAVGLGGGDEVAVLAEVRARKNAYRG